MSFLSRLIKFCIESKKSPRKELTEKLRWGGCEPKRKRSEEREKEKRERERERERERILN